MGFHRVVGDALVVLGELLPLGDEGLVCRILDRLEVVPGGKMADQRRGIDAGELFFTDEKATTGMSVALTPWLPSSL